MGRNRGSNSSVAETVSVCELSPLVKTASQGGALRSSATGVSARRDEWGLIASSRIPRIGCTRLLIFQRVCV